MPLSKAELLTPRIEVIADYPNSPFSVGDILTERTDLYVYPVFADAAHNNPVYISQGDAEQHPHLFRQLPWYEKRDIEDMPEYVKTGLINQRFSRVQWKPMYNGDNIESWKISEDGTFWKNIWSIPTIQPATQEEYEAYIKTKQ